MLTNIFQTTLCWGIFALLYHFWLQQETFFKANRLYLMATLVSGAVLPFLAAGWLPTLAAPAPDEGEMASVWLPTVVIGLKAANHTLWSSSWMPLLKIVYAAGALWAGCRFIAGLLRLYAVAARAGGATGRLCVGTYPGDGVTRLFLSLDFFAFWHPCNG